MKNWDSKNSQIKIFQNGEWVNAASFIGDKEVNLVVSKVAPPVSMNVLMIGNSFCYYYPDELFGMA